MIQRNKERGNVYIGIAFLALVAVAIVIFLFTSLKSYTPPPPAISEGTGLAWESVQENIQSAQEAKETLENKTPIAKILPFGGPLNGVSFSIRSPREDGTIKIILDANSDFNQAKEAALNWIKSQGYNPDELKLEYKTWAFTK